MSSADAENASTDIVIAIDGPSGSGKSSTSRGVADRLGLRYLDTGAQFRALTHWMLVNNVDVSDPVAVARRCGEAELESGTDPLNPTIRASWPGCSPTSAPAASTSRTCGSTTTPADPSAWSSSMWRRGARRSCTPPWNQRVG